MQSVFSRSRLTHFKSSVRTFQPLRIHTPVRYFNKSINMAEDHQDKDRPHPKFGHLPLATSGSLECALTVRLI